MAHYAFVDDSNVVTEVIVGNDETTGDWESHYAAVVGLRCLRTSYHTLGGQHLNGGVPFRLNYAGIGYTFDERLDGFIPPCPGEGFVLNEATGLWVDQAFVEAATL
jgi:hypothetical protein